MIPKTIHYCWFGRGKMPEQAERCIASWRKFMPDWNYRLWNDYNFDLSLNAYAREAYEARKFAFVSDYVRLWALEREGGVYLDTDVEVFKPFDDLLGYQAFAGFEGSKHCPVGTCVMASEAHGAWVSEQLEAYRDRRFLKDNGSFDLTTNVQFITARMCEGGFVPNGLEQGYKDLHVLPVEFFSPRQTTGEYLRTDNTYCDHLGLGTWGGKQQGWKARLARLVGQKNMIQLIKTKRYLFG
ncbi:MAG: glycosyl transferase [Bacteroidales bacterium]|nr:glycosyl transferase [Bacteroidales bacterium]